MRTSILAACAAACLTTPLAAQFSTALPVDGWTPHSGGAPEAVTGYAYDDGKSENAMNMQTGGQIAWLQRFDAVGGADVITSVSVAYGTKLKPGSSPPAGSPTNVAVWNDTDNDGDPKTGLVLLTQKATTIMAPDTDTFEKTTLSPVQVTGVFFVGAFTNNTPSQWPAGIDFNTPSNGRAWLSGSNTPNGFNPNNLNAPAHVGVYEMGNIGFPAVWLLRAEGIGVPTTFCAAKTAVVCGPSAIDATGIPSGTAASGFLVRAAPTRGCRAGLLLYSNQPPVAGAPFGGPGNGLLCLPPMGLRRAGPIDSGGSAPSACDGSLVIDMNRFRAFNWTATGCSPAPGQNNPAGFLSNFGVNVSAQFWYRDSIATGQGLSNGITWTVGP